jgi:hypothetical protein
MKRILFITAILLAAVTAEAQFTPMYSEVYNEKTDKLESKTWQSADGNTRQEYPNGNVTIIRLDSMTMYSLNPAKKTGSSIPISTITDPNKMMGRVVQTSHNEKREVVEKNVDVEGYLCDHITVTIVNTAPDGSQSGGVEHMWWHEPLKTWIRYGSGQFLHGETSIRRNIVPGPQPAHLFEIPKDYKLTTIPSGGLMEMMTGRKQTDEQKKQTLSEDDKLDIMTGGKGDAMKGAIQQQQEQNKKLDAISNDPDMTEQQKIMEALKMMGGNKKK